MNRSERDWRDSGRNENDNNNNTYLDRNRSSKRDDEDTPLTRETMERLIAMSEEKNKALPGDTASMKVLSTLRQLLVTVLARTEAGSSHQDKSKDRDSDINKDNKANSGKGIDKEKEQHQRPSQQIASESNDQSKQIQGKQQQTQHPQGMSSVRKELEKLVEEITKMEKKEAENMVKKVRDENDDREKRRQEDEEDEWKKVRQLDKRGELLVDHGIGEIDPRKTKPNVSVGVAKELGDLAKELAEGVGTVPLRVHERDVAEKDRDQEREKQIEEKRMRKGEVVGTRDMTDLPYDVKTTLTKQPYLLQSLNERGVRGGKKDPTATQRVAVVSYTYMN